MHTETATAKLTILAGNRVRLADGRVGTVHSLSGSTAEVEVAKPRTSPVAVIRSIDDVSELVVAEVASLRFAA